VVVIRIGPAHLLTILKLRDRFAHTAPCTASRLAAAPYLQLIYIFEDK
jgi:hypothetical protein